jgi:hyperosmotically inducible protein
LFLSTLVAVVVLGVAACDRNSNADKLAQDGASKAVAGMREATPAEGKPDAKVASTKAPTVASAAEKANAGLAAKVKVALATDPALRTLAIDGTAAEGAIMLFGTADSRAIHDRSAKLASNVEGVKSVTNNLALVRGS